MSKKDFVHALSVIGCICQWIPLKPTSSDRILTYFKRNATSEQTDATHKCIGSLEVLCLGEIFLCETKVVTSSSTAVFRWQTIQHSRQGGGTVKKKKNVESLMMVSLPCLYTSSTTQIVATHAETLSILLLISVAIRRI